MKKKAILAFANGDVFSGQSFAAEGTVCAELVFNTAMTGYQEILSDPSYANQIVTFSYPHIGNTGCNQKDLEANKLYVKGMICRNEPTEPSNWQSEISFVDFLKKHQLMAACGFDTRHLVHLLREKGSANVCLTTELSSDEAIAKAKSFSGLDNANLAKDVSAKNIQKIKTTHTAKKPLTLVAYDFGIKKSIIKGLTNAGFNLILVPYQTSADEALAYKPDGIFLSNGPGDPGACQSAIQATKIFIEQKIPLFGICLGFQILALALGGKTLKMKFGHHGANHPVKTFGHHQGVLISSQNHGFAVDESSLPGSCVITHRSLFDGSLQGFKVNNQMGFQGHPEAGPGPNDVMYLFDDFYALCQKNKEKLESACIRAC